MESVSRLQMRANLATAYHRHWDHFTAAVIQTVLHSGRMSPIPHQSPCGGRPQGFGGGCVTALMSLDAWQRWDSGKATFKVFIGGDVVAQGTFVVLRIGSQVEVTTTAQAEQDRLLLP